MYTSNEAIGHSQNREEQNIVLNEMMSLASAQDFAGVETVRCEPALTCGGWANVKCCFFTVWISLPIFHLLNEGRNTCSLWICSCTRNKAELVQSTSSSCLESESLEGKRVATQILRCVIKASHCSVTRSCLNLCNPMTIAQPSFSVFYLQEFAQIQCSLSQ